MSTVLLSPPLPAEDDATRRDLLKGAGVLTLAGFLAACGDEQPDIRQEAGARAIDHDLGRSHVPIEPRRVVVVDHAPTLGNLLALGITPVAAGSYAPTGPQPFHPVLDGLVDAVEPIQPYFQELPVEQVASLRPDLILSSGGLTADGLYQRLSALAATVPTVFVRTVDDIYRSVTDLAATVGRSERGAALVTDLERDLAPIGVTTGETVTFATVYDDGSLVVWIEGTDNAIAEAPGVEVVVPDVGSPSQESPDRISLSPERLPELSGDVVVLRQTLSVVGDAVAAESSALARLRENPLWQRVPAVRNDRVVLLDRFLFTGGVFGWRAAAEQLRQEFTAP